MRTRIFALAILQLLLFTTQAVFQKRQHAFTNPDHQNHKSGFQMNHKSLLNQKQSKEQPQETILGTVNSKNVHTAFLIEEEEEEQPLLLSTAQEQGIEDGHEGLFKNKKSKATMIQQKQTDPKEFGEQSAEGGEENYFIPFGREEKGESYEEGGEAFPETGEISNEYGEINDEGGEANLEHGELGFEDRENKQGKSEIGDVFGGVEDFPEDPLEEESNLSDDSTEEPVIETEEDDVAEEKGEKNALEKSIDKQIEEANEKVTKISFEPTSDPSQQNTNAFFLRQ